MYIIVVYRLCKDGKKKAVRRQYGCYAFDSMDKATTYVANFYDAKNMEFELYDVTKIKPRILRRKVLVE